MYVTMRVLSYFVFLKLFEFVLVTTKTQHKSKSINIFQDNHNSLIIVA